MTHDEMLVATEEAKLFLKQDYESSKQAVNNAFVSILNQLFGKGGENNGKQ
ncbi:hypothetical protein [Nicoliella lavandulae]|uniref:Uncharacterized protein n=1 Tax=Nicoliella lavandulae TaxID=3082954 RepID=A0ABU8SMD0_9LACO